jgi:phage gp29-like protein
MATKSTSQSFNRILQGMRPATGRQLATPETDPVRYFGNLFALPNPDPILRAMGIAERVYHSILVDPHVIGDVRSIRGAFHSHDYRIVPGDDQDPRSVEVKDFIEQWMPRTQPNKVADWMELMWQMTSSILTGYHPHEMEWGLIDGKFLPAQILDRPGRRFKFNANSEPLLVTNANLMGEPVDPYQFLITRHMATTVNPYGIPLLSSCFWPWTFKTGGFRYFVKYCERHGLPWPIARYPIGTPEGEQDLLAEAVSSMIEAGYVVVPEGTGLELLVPTSSGSNLPQQSLIDLCNTEMSKALTGQSSVGEHKNVGGRAHSETASKRQQEIHDSDRDIAAKGMSELFKWITLFNWGPDVAAPRLEFFKNTPAGLQRAQSYQTAANMGAKPSRKAMLNELGMPEADGKDDELLPNGGATGPVPKPPTSTAAEGDFGAYLGTVRGFSFAQAAGMTETEAIDLAANAADDAIERQMIQPIYEMLADFEAQGKTLADFKAAFEDQIGTTIDDEALREVIDRAMTYAILRGAATQAA